MMRLKFDFVIPSSTFQAVFLSFYAFLFASVPGYGANPQAGALDYIEGIEALESADFPRAVTSLTRAVQADDENAAYHRARGVANALAERVPEALADLQRALKLNPADREARLWLGLAYYMSGEPAKASMNFPHGGDISTHYANLVHNEVGAVYFASRYHGNYFDRQTRENVKVTGAVKTKFPDAARAYALRHKATGVDASSAIAARLKSNLERGAWSAALKDVDSLRLNTPDDPVLRGQYAQALLGLGNALAAREEFTRTLSIRPMWAEGYLGRAVASAILGDHKRAQSDLEAAASLGAKTSPADKKVNEVEKATELTAARKQFTSAVEQNHEVAELVKAADVLFRAVHSTSSHYDEGYQDRVYILSEGVRNHPKTADRHEILARFLYNHHIVPVVWNGPRSEGEQLRPQSKSEREAELQRALQSADEALKLDSRHAGAMATKGWLLYRLNQSAGAERLADGGLEIEPKSIRLLRLKAQILTDRASALLLQAAGLRQGRTETSRENRSDGVYEVRRYYAPSAEQLAQAAALESQAAACQNQAASLGRTANQVQKQDIPQLLAEADKARGSEDLKRARKALEQAYRYDPDLRAVCARLAELCKREGKSRDQRMFALLAEPIQHSNPADHLKVAWEQIGRTAWKSAEDALKNAENIRPSDARIFAYRSVVSTNRAMPEVAAKERKAALALEEARARLMGTSLFGQSANSPDLNVAGLAMIVALHDGNAHLENKDYNRSTNAFRMNLNLEQRWRRDRMVELVTTAMLPDPNLEEGRIPEAPTLASLAAWSRIGIAQAMLATKRPEEAREQFKAVRAYLADWPPTSKDRQTLYVADAWAQLGLAEAAFAEKDYETTFKLLTREGSSGALPERLEQRKKELIDMVVAKRHAQEDREEQSFRNMSVGEQLRYSEKQQIALIEQQRDAMKKELEDPSLDALTRQTIRDSIAQLDGVIESMKASANQSSGRNRQTGPQDRISRPSRTRTRDDVGGVR